MMAKDSLIDANHTRVLGSLRGTLVECPAAVATGRITDVSPLAVQIAGLSGLLTVGDRLNLRGRGGADLPAEVLTVHGGRLHAAPFGDTLGIGAGGLAVVRLGATCAAARGELAPCDAWLGRVIDPLGRPLDGLGPLPPGDQLRAVRAAPPPATLRARLGPVVETGVRVLDCFTTCRTGQRMGLFAGSGVGKSTLLAMLARHARCDVAVLALVGERGREVREFIEDDLGPDGLARSVVVVATGDAPPLLRREAAYAALTVAEHFRDQGKSVLLLMDSVTRFCLALRELNLAAGEPPATRGYPPSVFAELPRLLERAGPGPIRSTGQAGHITALFTVLVDGGDHDEPIADAVRGILDGHVVLDRKIGEGGRYPAVDPLRSLSRAAASILTAEQAALVRRARAHLSIYADMEDMVRLGAYKPGADPVVDRALRAVPKLEALMRQGRDEPESFTHSFSLLRAALADG
jgi:flagellum-specific ATP synthase